VLVSRSHGRAILGAKSTEDHLRGCALSTADERVNCDDGRVVELSSSPISMMASPDNVASVSVGEVGELVDFSSVRVSPVIVRARDITTVGLKRSKNEVRKQKLRAIAKTGHFDSKTVAQRLVAGEPSMYALLSKV
jgi:hypothetical protein